MIRTVDFRSFRVFSDYIFTSQVVSADMDEECRVRQMIARNNLIAVFQSML